MADAPQARRRFRVTPDGLVLGLLPLEGLLWLSQRFRWFPFNEHKGYTVLIAVASIGLFFALMLLWLAAALVFRVRFQFTLRSLFVLTLAVALACSWLAVERNAAKKQREAVWSIRKVEGCIQYGRGLSFLSIARPPAPKWLRGLLGDDFFIDVKAVVLWGSSYSDAVAENLRSLSRLESLKVVGREITDARIEHLKGLRQLRELDLSETEVTDAGLEHLRELRDLQQLSLILTKVTDAGVAKLQRALPKCEIMR